MIYTVLLFACSIGNVNLELIEVKAESWYKVRNTISADYAETCESITITALLGPWQLCRWSASTSMQRVTRNLRPHYYSVY